MPRYEGKLLSFDTDIRKAPNGTTLPLPTGPVQFGDAWPGIYIDGQTALSWVDYLRRLKLTQDTVVRDAIIDDLSALFESCYLKR